jgi:hypothetical protein
MTLDKSLISEAEGLATGTHVHKVANMVAAYKMAYGFAVDNGDQISIDLFKDCEKDLRKFVAPRRQKKYEYRDDLKASAKDMRKMCKAHKRKG